MYKKIINKAILLFFLSSGTAIMHNNCAYGAIPSLIVATSLGKASAVIGGLVGAYYWFVPDTSMPKFDQLNVVTLLPTGQKSSRSTDRASILKILRAKKGTISINGMNYEIHSGIPEGIANQRDPISLYSGGYSNNGNPYAYCAYTAIKCGLITGPCITFDYATDTRRAFNFCQKQDIHCVKLVYDRLIKQAPKASVILHGACKGSMNNLRFLEVEASKKDGDSYLANIKAVIAESPVISVQKALGHWKNGGMLSHLLCRFALPNYTPKIKTIMQAARFPGNIPVFVGSLPQDTLSQHADMVAMCEHLRALSTNKNIEHFTSKHKNIMHGQIGKAADYREAVHSFLERNRLKMS